MEQKDKKVYYDYSKLRGRIIEKYGTIKKYSKAINMNYYSLISKLNNKHYFTQNEIKIQATLLNIKSEEIGVYFCTLKNIYCY
jgi:hypothetical protein